MSVLVQWSVRQTLVRMAVPMLAGTFAMNAYNLADAWFVSRLGTKPLAAVASARTSFPAATLPRHCVKTTFSNLPSGPSSSRNVFRVEIGRHTKSLSWPRTQ